MKSWLRFPYRAVARAADVLATAVPRDSRSKLTRAFAARRNLLERYRKWGNEERDMSRPLLWLHAASVGEALMALPVAQQVRRGLPRVQIAYTFFSPSAESIAGNMVSDFADYLPFDSTHAVRTALDALRPTVLVFAKGDVWPTLVRESARRGVALGLVSASMQEHSGRASGIGSLLTREAYGALNMIGAASDDDARVLIRAGARPGRIRVTGDTRYDQAWERAHVTPRNQDTVSRLESTRPTIVAGSTWPADEQQLLPAFDRLRRVMHNVRIIIAPHELGGRRIAALEESAAVTAPHIARVGAPGAADADVVIVDRLGMLADLYALATVAYVGGGFSDSGLHSLVEPAVFRVPVIIGPRHTGSRDARMMLAAGGVIPVHDTDALFNALHRILTDTDERTSMSDAMGVVVSDELGAAERSFEIVRELLGSV